MAPRRPKPVTAARQALLAAIARGLLKPHGGHFAVISRAPNGGKRVRVYQRRYVERALAEQ